MNSQRNRSPIVHPEIWTAVVAIVLLCIFYGPTMSADKRRREDHVAAEKAADLNLTLVTETTDADNMILPFGHMDGATVKVKVNWETGKVMLVVKMAKPPKGQQIDGDRAQRFLESAVDYIVLAGKPPPDIDYSFFYTDGIPLSEPLHATIETAYYQGIIFAEGATRDSVNGYIEAHGIVDTGDRYR